MFGLFLCRELVRHRILIIDARKNIYLDNIASCMRILKIKIGTWCKYEILNLTIVKPTDIEINLINVIFCFRISFFKVQR